MKRIALLLTLLVSSQLIDAQSYQYTDGTKMTVVGKLLSTAQPWHRVDTEKYPQMTKSEALQGKLCAGMALAFKTNSSYIGVKAWYGKSNSDLRGYGPKGFDLYIKEGGKWIYAGNERPKKGESPYELVLLKKSEPVEKECLLYLPLFQELERLEVVTDEGSFIAPAQNPFKGRIAVFGSSFTQGAGAERAALSYSAQLARMTGYHFINMGFSGNSKLQSYFADILLEAEDVDAYVCDAFSNPSVQQIEERLFPFIEKFQAKAPGVPLIFIKTLYREKRNFDPAYRKREEDRIAVADSLMKIALKKYENVYWVDSTCTLDGTHEWTADGSHPDGYGYRLMAESLAKPLDKILRKYVK